MIYKHPTFCGLFLLSCFFFNSPAFADLNASKKNGASAHLSSVGYVIIGESAGSGTYIGEGLVITVAHNLIDLLEESAPKRIKGTKFVEVTNFEDEDVWNNIGSSESDPKKYRTKKAT